MAEFKERKNKRVEDLKKAFEAGGRILPNNFEAEQAVLGCALIDSEICLNIVGKLEDSDFYNETHRHIFRAIKELHTSQHSQTLCLRQQVIIIMLKLLESNQF